MILLSNQPLYSKRLESVQTRIAAACKQSSRPVSDVLLLAVSKRHTAAAIKVLHSLGLNEFGESYASEGSVKQQQLADENLVWHFIGPLQSNKTALVARHFDWIHSVDRVKIATRLDRQRPQDMPPLNVLVQVNIDAEPQKAGVLVEDLEPLVDLISTLPALRLRGLMAIPRVGKPTPEQRQSFQAMRNLFESLQSRYETFDTLSMGMSDDLESAIMEGSTMIRIGTALFGPREE